MKLIYNTGYWLERELYVIAGTVIDERVSMGRMPSAIEVEHVMWVHVAKSYMNDPRHDKFFADYSIYNSNRPFRKI